MLLLQKILVFKTEPSIVAAVGGAKKIKTALLECCKLLLCMPPVEVADVDTASVV